MLPILDESRGCCSWLSRLFRSISPTGIEEGPNQNTEDDVQSCSKSACRASDRVADNPSYQRQDADPICRFHSFFSLLAKTTAGDCLRMDSADSIVFDATTSTEISRAGQHLVDVVGIAEHLEHTQLVGLGGQARSPRFHPIGQGDRRLPERMRERQRALLHQ